MSGSSKTNGKTSVRSMPLCFFKHHNPIHLHSCCQFINLEFLATDPHFIISPSDTERAGQKGAEGWRALGSADAEVPRVVRQGFSNAGTIKKKGNIIYLGQFLDCHSIWHECALNNDLPIYCLRQMQHFLWSIKLNNKKCEL